MLSALAAMLLCVAEAQASERVVLLEVQDDTSQGVAKVARQSLEAALAQAPGVTLLPSKSFLAMAKKRKIARRRLLEPEVIAKLARGAKVDYVLVGRFQRSGLGYELILLAHSVRSGDVIEVRSINLRQPRIDTSIAAELVKDLLARLKPTTVEAEEDEPPAPAAAIAEDDAWTSVPETTFDEVGSEPAILPSTVWSGRVQVQHHTFTDDLGPNVVSARDSVEANLRMKVGNDDAMAYGEVTARRDFADRQRDRFDVSEGYAQVGLGPVTVRAGRIIASWGAASLANPTDVLNPVDLRDVMRPEKLGTWMMQVGTVVGVVRFDLYYLPVPELHLLPLPTSVTADGRLEGSSRWLPANPSPNVPDGVALTYNYAPPQARRGRLRDAQGAARMSVSAGGVDASIGYASLYERAPPPRMTVTPTAADAATVDIDFTTRRFHVVTADAETVLGKLRLAVEGSALLPTGASTSELNGNVVLSGDYRTGQFFDDHAVQFFVDLVWSSEDDPDSFGNAIGGFIPIGPAVFARVAYEAGEDLRFEVTGVSAIQRSDMFVRPSIEYIASSLVHLRLGYEWLGGDSNGLFGRYSKNSRAYVELEATF